MQPSLPRLAFLTIFALLVTVTSGVRAQTPTVLPPLPGDNQSQAFWINDWGEVVGNSISEPPGNTPGGTITRTAVVWDSEGTPTALPPLEGDTDSFAGSGNSINNHGHVAGFSRNDSGIKTAVVWDRNGTIIMVLPPLAGDIITTAVAISAHGRVAGESIDSGLSIRAVSWDQKGNPTVLSQSGGSCSMGALSPNSINPRTMVTGGCKGVFGIGVVWDRKGASDQLPPLTGFDGSDAFSINARGEVAGISFNTEGGRDSSTATVWDSKGTPSALPPLGGDTESSAFGINHRSVVVGKSEFRDEPGVGGAARSTAVIWDRDGTPTALPFGSPGIEFCEARGINKREVVVGYCLCESCDDPSPLSAIVWR